MSLKESRKKLQRSLVYLAQSVDKPEIVLHELHLIQQTLEGLIHSLQLDHGGNTDGEGTIERKEEAAVCAEVGGRNTGLDD